MERQFFLVTTKSSDIPATGLSDLRRKKDWVDLGATQRFWTETIGQEIQQPNHWTIALKLLSTIS